MGIKKEMLKRKITGKKKHQDENEIFLLKSVFMGKILQAALDSANG
jgi:hypothetical protein